MKKLSAIMLGAVIVLLWGNHLALAASSGIPAEAVALVKKAVASIKTGPIEKSIAEISDPQGKFVAGDLYVFVYDMEGKCLANGFKQEMIGRDLSGMKDRGGKFFVKETIAIGKTKGKGWQTYYFTNPLSGRTERKFTYVETVDGVIVGCGSYYPILLSYRNINSRPSGVPGRMMFAFKR